MFDDLIYAINGCIFKVYNTLDNIWPEEVYENALELALQDKGIAVQRQVPYNVLYFQTS